MVRREGKAEEIAEATAEAEPCCTLTEGKEGFDFLGCHLHMRMSGKLWEEKRIRRYYLQRWPSKRSMKRVRTKVKELTELRGSGPVPIARHRAVPPHSPRGEYPPEFIFVLAAFYVVTLALEYRATRIALSA